MATTRHAATGANSRPIRFFPSAGQAGDHTGAAAMLDGLPKAEWLREAWQRKKYKSAHLRPDVPQEESHIRQAALQKAQSQQDHVPSVERPVTTRHAFRQVPGDRPLRNQKGPQPSGFGCNQGQDLTRAKSKPDCGPVRLVALPSDLQSGHEKAAFRPVRSAAGSACGASSDTRRPWRAR